ncbi:AraC-like DNA-binding protein/cbb3-type cytochrome oxidase subunit 3 [Clostridium pascui]|uniref:AraC family transcriptional regulator n=1 Tax=Clostridium pascui TaxID=46609 RepID=UPI00195E8E65|nr:AraC family transcriptional regulator [Clostridium pascui]MBM7871517.1 AraC-like DNA-binding protein/cbb3-type cytochrome oxidase subunit 3 [Clostridium pascui]
MNNIYQKFKKNIKAKNTFHKLMLSYVIFIVLFLLTTMFVLYKGYKKQIVEQSSRVSENIINQAEYYTGYTLDWAKSYIYKLYLDEQVYNLMFDYNSNSKLGFSPYLKVKQAAAMIPSIQSVYVYNRNNKMIYSSDGNSSYYSLFYDSDIMKRLKESTESLSSNFISRQITVPINGEEYKRNILTLILSNSKSDIDGNPYGAIVLNLDANSVQAYFHNMSESDYNLMAINKKGQVILHSDEDMFLKDISNLNYVDKIINSKNKQGSFLVNIEESPSIVTYRYSKKLDLFFLNIVRYDTLIESIRGMSRFLILAFILLFLFGLGYSVFTSKKIYKPIAETVNTVKKYLDVDEDINKELGIEENSRNEMEYVTKVVDTLMNKPISFAKLSDKDLYFIRNQLLKALLLNMVTEFESFKVKLKEVGFEVASRNMAIVLFKMDFYKKLIKEKGDVEFKSLKRNLYIELSNISKEYFDCEIIGLEEDEICLIIKVKDKIDDELTNKIVQLIQEIQETVLNRLNISLSASIGRYAERLEEASVAYKTAKDYINYRFKYGPKSILINEQITQDISGESKYEDAHPEALFKAVKLGNLDEVETELDKVFSILKKMSYSDMRISITQFGINSQKVINNICHMSKENAYIDIKELTDNLFNYETIDEVKDYFLNIYKSVLIQIKEKKSNRKNDVIESVKKYINQNYCDQLLALEVIASEMRLSPNYLRTMFKESEGKSISNYINEVRFEKAKELLKTTELTAKEISIKIGFENFNYFYTAFKKYYGVSPNQFRNNINSIYQ